MDRKQGLGASAGILAILALVWHVTVPTTSKNPEDIVETNSKAKYSTAGSTPVGASQVRTAKLPEIEGPWLATQTFFHEEPSGLECPNAVGTSEPASSASCSNVPDLSHVGDVETCVNDTQCSESLRHFFGVNDNQRKPRIQYIVATIADPLHTRLALSTDSSIEAIEKAAFNSHWEFAAQWLPWYNSVDPGEKDPEKRSKQRALVKEQEAQPGLLVFRHGPVSEQPAAGNSRENRFDENVLFIFLVGETPTAGINGVAFRMARAYMRALGDAPEVRISGPSFSGSFYSLSQLIKADQNRQTTQQPGTSSRYVVRGGTASNSDPADVLKHTRNVEFNGTGENSTDHTAHFKSVLADFRIKPDEAAILCEDDTAFSKQFPKQGEGGGQMRDTIVLRFPRDISHLRNVYRNIKQNTGDQNSAQSVELSLKDEESGEDTVPIFSAAQTPLAQNSVLDNIISEIRSRRLRLVEIAATNVLDTLFLAELLRQQCPDVRLLVDEPDLLFVKAAQTEPFNGMLAISSYPLFSASRDWSLDGSGITHPIHENSGAEALFNSVGSFLFAPDHLGMLNDYAWDGSHRPQAWLLELSRQGFSPVELFKNQDASWYFDDPEVSKATFRLPTPSTLWFLLTSVLAAISLAFCAWITRLHRNKYVLIWSVAAPDGDHIADAYRLMFLFFSLLILAVAQAILYIPVVAAQASVETTSLAGNLLSIIGIVVPFGFAVWLLSLIFAKPRVTLTRYVYAASGIVIAFLIAGFWYWSCVRSRNHTGFFLAMRAVEMRLGTSPSLPILFLLAALFVFSVCHLVRFYFLISHRPRMFTATIDKFSKGKLRNCRRAMNRLLASPMDLKPREQALLVLTIAAVFLTGDLLVGGHSRLSSTEGRQYDAIILLLLSLVLSAIALTMIQIRKCWIALQQILTRFNILPLMSYFTELREAGKTAPIWARRFNLQSLDPPTKSIIILHNLRVALADRPLLFPQLSSEQISTWFDGYREALGNLIAAKKENSQLPVPRDEPMDRTAIRKEFGRLRYLGAAISHDLNGSVIVPEWTGTQLPWNPPSTEEKTTTETKCNEVKEQLPSELAQIFVALQYSMFINYGVRQIQNLLLSVSLGYALLVIALNVYAFEAPHLINRVLLVLFVVLGIVIWQVMSQMERDPILSRLSGTTEGELSRNFYLKIFGYSALPIVSLLSSQFPAIAHFLTSWVEPSLEAFK